jgi:predicted ATP-dependent endonuclease of OLD family
VTVIACGGKSKIKHYKTLCDAYNIQSFIVYDLDNKDDSDSENACLKTISGGFSAAFAGSFESLMEEKCSISKQELLDKIPSIPRDKIPEEVVGMINAIHNWVYAQKN